MKSAQTALLFFSLVVLGACSKTVTTKTHTEETRTQPVRQVTVEKRMIPNADGSMTEQEVVRERTVPKTTYRWEDRESTSGK